MTDDLRKKIFSLSDKEKLELANELWDDVAGEDDEISDDVKRILDERLDRIERGEATYISLEDMLKKYER